MLIYNRVLFKCIVFHTLSNTRIFDKIFYMPFFYFSFMRWIKRKKCKKWIGIKKNNCTQSSFYSLRRFALFRFYFVEFAKKIRRSFTPLCRSIERVHRDEDAAAEKGNETSPALLYLSSLLCLRQNAPSSYRVCLEGQKRPLRREKDTDR